jgi:hypothetical protein
LYRPILVSLAVLGPLLNIAGVLLPSSGAPLYVVVVNHLMSGILVWLVAYIALTHTTVGDNLRASLSAARNSSS